MLSQACHPLNNGARIPSIGFSWVADGSEQYEKILHALKVEVSLAFSLASLAAPRLPLNQLHCQPKGWETEPRV